MQAVMYFMRSALPDYTKYCDFIINSARFFYTDYSNFTIDKASGFVDLCILELYN